tara:strand:+ start:319 stop:936 length:618 start_codon:yes stop_codon:yes gene_type:complete
MNNIIKSVKDYYTDKLKQHGPTAAGVDWNSLRSQIERFDQLNKLLPRDREFTLCDIGCGYGALLNYLRTKHNRFKYEGVDISCQMLNAAKVIFYNSPNVFWTEGTEPSQKVDYCLASGIFNVRLETSEEQWQRYLMDSLSMMNKNSYLGYAFNCLSTYSEKKFQRKDLFYCNPLTLFDFCKKEHSKNVSLLHDYNMYEFTIIVRK